MTRFGLPFFSTKYKTNVTINCLLKVLGASLILDDEYQLEAEEVESLVQIPPTDRWQAPELKRQFKFDGFFSLCIVVQIPCLK